MNRRSVSDYWVARISEDYRAVGIESGGTVTWFWIGPHDEYDRLLARLMQKGAVPPAEGVHQFMRTSDPALFRTV